MPHLKANKAIKSWCATSFPWSHFISIQFSNKVEGINWAILFKQCIHNRFQNNNYDQYRAIHNIPIQYLVLRFNIIIFMVCVRHWHVFNAICTCTKCIIVKPLHICEMWKVHTVFCDMSPCEFILMQCIN